MNSQPIRIVLRWNERKGVEKGGKVQGGAAAMPREIASSVLSDMLGRPFLHTSLYNILRYDALILGKLGNSQAPLFSPRYTEYHYIQI